MKAILTAVGKDRTGIIAGISQFLAEHESNIIDLSQTIMDGYFTMVMMVSVPENADFMRLAQEVRELGASLGVDVTFRNAQLYDAMHQL